MSGNSLPGLFELTPLNPSFSENPYTMLDRLREQCPVHRDKAAGAFILTSFPNTSFLPMRNF